MTKCKKRLLIALVCMLCVLTTLFSVYWFVPYTKHWTFKKTPVETDQFLPKPDSMLYIENGKARKLTDEQRDAVYEEFMMLMSSEFQLGSWMGPLKPKHVWHYITEDTCLEFRYAQRQRFVGKLEDTRKSSIDVFEFDAVLFTLAGAILPYKGIRYRGFGKMRSRYTIEWKEEEKQRFFIERLYEILG